MRYKTGDIVWSRMPFSHKTMEKIDKNHQIRPYLIICGNEKDGYYAFSMTSSSHEKDLENNIVELSSPKNKKGKNSTIKLADCYLLPNINIIENHSKLPTDKKNEVFKKLKRNIKFHEYPREVIDVITSTQTFFSTFDIVENNSSLYMVSSVNEYTSRAICTKIYRHPKNATYRVTLDGKYFYIDFNDVRQIDVDSLNFYTSFKSISKDSILYNNEVVMEDRDLTKLDNLVMGSVISFMIDGERRKAVLLEKNNGYISIIMGKDTERFKEFKKEMVSVNSEFTFIIESTITKERLEMYKNIFIPSETSQTRILK